MSSGQRFSEDRSDAGAIPEDDGGFLGRWSRRKGKARAGELTDESPPVPEGTSEQHPAPALTDADMPPVTSLNETSDYTGFLSPEVSEGLRRVALRKLFHQSGFNVVDGLDDYAEDYTYFEPLGDIITSDMRHQMEVEKQRKVDAAKAAEDEALQQADAGIEDVESDEPDESPTDEVTEGAADGPEENGRTET